MKKLTTVIICAGGYGTRFLPFSNSLSKELLPIGGVPAIQLVVEECLEADFEKIIIVTRSNSNAIQDHFKENIQLRKYLKSVNKNKELEILNLIPKYENLIFVREDENIAYGNLAPILSAADYLSDDESFAVVFSDDLIIKGTGIKELKTEYIKGNYDGIIAAKKIERKRMTQFGNLIVDENLFLQEILQKPTIEEIRSDLALVSRLILPKSVLNNIQYYSIEPDLGKTISYHCKKMDFYVKEIQGQWLNIDDPISYYLANKTYYELGGDINDY